MFGDLPAVVLRLLKTLWLVLLVPNYNMFCDFRSSRACDETKLGSLGFLINHAVLWKDMPKKINFRLLDKSSKSVDSRQKIADGCSVACEWQFLSVVIT